MDNPSPSSSISASTSATKSASKRSGVVRTTMPWYGVLTNEQRNTLLELYGDALVLPGSNMRRIRYDAEGKICIPGSATTFHESKRTLDKWSRNAKSEDATGWLKLLDKADMSVLKIRDVLTGLEMSKWNKYKQLYDRELSRVRCLRYRTQLREAAMSKADKERQEKQDFAVDGMLRLKHDQTVLACTIKQN